MAPVGRKRGTAVVKKKPSKYITVDSDGEEVKSDNTSHEGGEPVRDIHSSAQRPRTRASAAANRKQSTNRGSPIFVDEKSHDSQQSIANAPSLGRGDPATPPEEDREPSAKPGSIPVTTPQVSLNREPTPSTSPPEVTQPVYSPFRKRKRGRKQSRKQSLKPQTPALPNKDILPLHLPSIDDEEVMSYVPPSQQRYMRACMVCSIVRTQQQFQTQGCPNCESFLELIGNPEAIQECTSSVFDGLLTVADTSKSWVARHQRLEGYVPGVYAVQVEGILPEEVIVAAENAGIQYIARDGTVDETLPTEG